VAREGETRDDRRRRYGLVLGLWKAENPLKTLKLQVLLLTNALLLPSFLEYRGGAGAVLLALFMIGADLVWVFSIGRTVASQHLWKAELETIQEEDPDDPFLSLHAQAHRKLAWWGSLPSATYLVGSPIALSLSWAFLCLWALASLR